ncbi:hypothetical protein BACCIP111883_00900 [Sutcliffiella rhizosphaerae]|uniref:Uncharacterized protein n=1 Tax=Sutcliffiella rhizosphaerae TaxID=2880967 RepID=A0ABM8YJS7_9BACI|nr:hypothetical protein BACCIP111883_00900 [Sutcliffiella rhizosphaerae]
MRLGFIISGFGLNNGEIGLIISRFGLIIRQTGFNRMIATALSDVSHELPLVWHQLTVFWHELSPIPHQLDHFSTEVNKLIIFHNKKHSPVGGKVLFSSLFCSVKSIACIAKAWYNVTFFIQLFIKCRDVDVHVRVCFLENLYSFWGSN